MNVVTSRFSECWESSSSNEVFNLFETCYVLPSSSIGVVCQCSTDYGIRECGFAPMLKCFDLSVDDSENVFVEGNPSKSQADFFHADPVTSLDQVWSFEPSSKIFETDVVCTTLGRPVPMEDPSRTECNVEESGRLQVKNVDSTDFMYP